MTQKKRKKIWESKYIPGDAGRDAAIQKMACSLGVSPLFATLLYNRGYTDADAASRFLRFAEEDFHDPFLMRDMERAVERILRAVRDGEKIYVYGDYDVDGVTSVSLLYLYLTSLGASVRIKIPKRDGEGYGVSSAAVDAISADGATLVVTVDTGITAIDEVEYARSIGVDFVITDHHECHGALPNAVAVVNPHRPDCSYPFSELAGVGVIFKVVCACEMRRYEREGKRAEDGLKRICEEYCELVAVGTIADVMPLVDENRPIVKLGLDKLERGEGRPGLLSLIDASSKKTGDDKRQRKVTSGTIGFGIAPKINAAGRMSDALIAARLLLADDAARVAAFTEELCEINRRRQLEENAIATQVYEMIENDSRYENDKVIILSDNDWQQGIIGIVSSRVTEKYGLPSILVSYRGSVGEEESDDDDGKGSGRSVKGLNLVEALASCEDLLVKYGGHELAAGLTVKRGKLEEFRRRINEYAREHLSDEALSDRALADCEIRGTDVSMRLATELTLLEPFGIGNAAPEFIIKNADVCRVTYLGGGKHTKLTLKKDGELLTAMYFGVGEGELDFCEGDTVDVLFSIDVNEFRGIRSVQLILRDARPSEDEQRALDGGKLRYAEIKRGARFSESEELLPSRDDFAAVYNMLRRHYRAHVSSLTVKEMLHALKAEGTEIVYCKLKFILAILRELQICEIEETGEDVYSFEIFFNASKTSIEKSSILKKLRGQCDKIAE
ncbi:MAG: single-stranded-DNA-specific exonuclease RecJ [Ruminococcaceae bacterium]|nr:single-stranded-DNA-specific exonuclease RecJ [Oscillospiraceae bacterium]